MQPGTHSQPAICAGAEMSFALQKVMGHSDLETTKRYAHMTTEDLQAVHERLSLLSR